MSFEKGKTGIGSTVSAQYGARKVGNQEGVYRTEGVEVEVAINFDGDNLDTPVPIPAGAVVVAIDKSLTGGTVSTIAVEPYDGTSDINIVDAVLDADGTRTGAVTVGKAGFVKWTGTNPTGTLLIRYIRVA